MPFGQIEQSWFEDDLWSLHALSKSPQCHQVAEQNQLEEEVRLAPNEPELPIAELTSPLPENAANPSLLSNHPPIPVSKSRQF